MEKTDAQVSDSKIIDSTTDGYRYLIKNMFNRRLINEEKIIRLW